MIAVTRNLDDTPLASAALVDIAGDTGLLFRSATGGLVGIGCAAVVDADRAVTELSSIECRNESSSEDALQPIAIGCVDFLPQASATLTIPRVTIIDNGAGDRFAIVCADKSAIDETLESVVVHPAPHPVANSYQVDSPISISTYLKAVEGARDAVRAGSLHKAVIARPVMVKAREPMSIHAVLRRLDVTFGSTYRFSIDGFIGASPELLVSVNGAIVRSHPLAGTTRTTGNDAIDAQLAAELLASEKNQIEHHAAIEMVRDSLLPFCSYLDWTPEPSVIKVANVQHLGSLAEGHLSDPHPSVVELVRELQPTPAVGGHPRDAAIDMIVNSEGFTRGRYGGAVGWVNAAGDGEWAVSLRCAEFSQDRREARLVAGGGIVADSDPESELAETQAKLQAMLGAIIRP
ncbi:MAG: isochorismate synthase [Ilumatobacteraceae bacterium]